MRTREQETDPTFWSLYMHFVYCTQWDKIQLEQKFLRAPVGSRHHFGTFISMALLIQFTVGRLSIAYFSPCWNRHSGIISTGAAYLTPSTLYHLYNHKLTFSQISKHNHVISLSFKLNNGTSILIMKPVQL